MKMLSGVTFEEIENLLQIDVLWSVAIPETRNILVILVEW